MANRKAPAEIGPDFTPEALAERVSLNEGLQLIEIDYTGLDIRSSAEVNAFYDHVEDVIHESGEDLWFFLIDITDYRIESEAWFAYSRRGSDMHEAHSMGTLRLDRSPGMAGKIAAWKGTDRERPDHFPSREAALEEIRRRPTKRRLRRGSVPNYNQSEFRRRIHLDGGRGIAEIDLSGISFEHGRDVNDIFNWIEEAVRATRQKWFFLFNYEGTRIQQPAWLAYSVRAEALRDRWSLGSVRYAAGSETAADIRLRAENRTFRPNIRNTRAEALALIEDLRAGAAVSADRATA